MTRIAVIPVRLMLALLVWVSTGLASAQSFLSDVQPLIEGSCISCHDSSTQTRLDFDSLGHDLTDPDTFRMWERIYDRVGNGEMPPSSRPRPDSALLNQVLSALEEDLRDTNLAWQREHGRVASRRLTRLEYDYTIGDLLLIEADLAKTLPEESDSGGFDTVGATQGISPVHIRSYLQAADQALDTAIVLDSRPESSRRLVDYFNSPYVNRWYDTPIDQGGKVIKKLDDAVALFVDLDYIMRSDASGLKIPTPGFYRITVEAYAYQAKSLVTLKLIRASEARGGAELLGAFDLEPDQTRSVEVTTFLQPGDYLYPSVADLDPHAGVYAAGGAENYKGEGIGIKSMHIDGPLLEEWPPASTRQLLSGVRIEERSGFGAFLFTGAKGDYYLQLDHPPIDHVRDIATRFAPLAFRRPAGEEEIDSFVRLAEPAVAEGRDFAEAVRLPLRSMLSSPQFLFFDGEPGELDDHALATRLSYFLWKSMPDEELFRLAAQGNLSDPEVLAGQVDRMLDDEKAERFIRDFLGQWLDLDDLNATTPDERLYPEYDDLLNQAIARETELFFTELIQANLGVSNLVDSDFTFLNRRLAEHYGIPGVEGQKFRKVMLPEDSPRGGILTHASVLKVTANGTVTSPVMRGNFVLTNLLGQPTDPPPPNVGSIEPDTRGTTTIRETLAAHRNVAACARCHNQIDPPGFALESFDPIGGFRTHYRATPGREIPFQGTLRIRAYQQGPEVDASGVTADGKTFSGINEFKQILVEHEDQVARHFIAQLVVYATGGEVQFADRERIEDIVSRTRAAGYPVRTIIHEVIQSSLFRDQ